MAKARRFWRDWWSAIVIAVCLTVILASVVSAAVKATKSSCSFCPVEAQDLTLTPVRARVGDRVTLTDGICNRTDQPLTAELYLGAQQQEQPSLTSRTIDLLTRVNESGQRETVRDTPEGRLRRVLEPGCTVTEPITAPLPPSFTTGVWLIRVHIVVRGENNQVQDINKLSGRFEVTE